MKRSGNNQFSKISIEDVISKANKKGLRLIYNDSIYKNEKTKIDFIDNNNYKYHITYDSLRRNYPHNIFGKHKYSIDNINQYIINNKIDVKLISTEYKNCKEKIVFKCSCGAYFEKTLDGFINKNEHCCKKCGFKIGGDKKRHGFNWIKNDIEKNGYKLISEVCNGVLDDVIIEDKKGYRYLTNHHNMCYRNSFYKYYPSNSMSVYNMKHYIAINKIKTELLSDKFISSGSKLNFKCECGNEFQTTWTSFMADKTRCSSCTNAISNIEYKIQKYLEENKFIFKPQYKFEKCRYKQPLFFDFAIFDNNQKLRYLIEVQGAQHYRPVTFGFLKNEEAEENFKKQQIKDNIKRKYCYDNNIPLLEIKYTEIEKNNTKYINKLKLFDLAHQI